MIHSVHPHACGECVGNTTSSRSIAGSPPRLWGMRLAAAQILHPPRFTPTPVGNAPARGWLAALAAVHPHACGECRQMRLQQVRRCGSPPRLWGMPPDQPAAPRSSRFTPTPVGNAGAPSCVWRVPIGSPPRLWGMLDGSKVRFNPLRFTPTPVGNAWCISFLLLFLSVHPHACGECKVGMAPVQRDGGSPPRLWGMRGGVGGRLRNGRFTPTPVGNAPPPTHPASPSAVHPHACGECGSPW